MVYETVKGKEAVECASSLVNIGNLHENNIKFNEALQYYNKALSIFERVEGKESLYYAKTLSNVGNLYYGQGKLN